MNEHSRNELLDAVLTQESRHVPSSTQVIHLIHRERSRCRYRKTFLAMTSGILIGAFIIIRDSSTKRTSQSPPTTAMIPLSNQQETPQRFHIDRIGDEELLQMLAGQPAALVQASNGEREL